MGMKDLPDKSIDLVVTDPPYLHVKGGMKSKVFNKAGTTWGSDSHMVNKMSDFDKEQIFEFLEIVLQKQKKANMYVFCSKLQLLHYFEFISEYNSKVPKSRGLKYDLLVWDKMNTSMKSSKFYTSDIEYVVRIYEAGVSLNKVWNEDSTKADSRFYTKRQAFKQPKGKHKTMKPTELLERFILVASEEGDVVLDPFMGSGSTAEACLNTGRKYIGYEWDNEYIEVSSKRIEEITT